MALSTIASAYVNYRRDHGPEDSPATLVIAWLSQIGFFPALLAIVIFIPLLFPDGRYSQPAVALGAASTG